MNKCMICGTELRGTPLMELRNAPACAQDLPKTREASSRCGIDLNLYQCSNCGLVQFDCEPVPYYRDVIRGGGFSETIQSLRKKQYSRLIERYNLYGRKIIEIGCGEGEFILPLKDFPVKAFGIEHRKELVLKAKARGLDVWEAFPESPETVIDNGPFDCFLMFQFLEHQPRPNDMLRCIKNNLTENGIGLITVPSFEYVISKNGFYELMRDHIAYYTKETFYFLMQANGFEVLEFEIVNGNTISAVVRKRKMLSLKDFSDNLNVLTDRLKEFSKEQSSRGKKIAVWGASHQAFMILSVTGFGDNVEYIVDSADFKQDKYAPASNVPIVAPEHWFSNPVDCIVIIAPEYAKEISFVAKQKFGNEIETYSLNGSDLFLI